MRKHIVAANFHVVVSQGADKPGRKIEFTKGRVLEDKDIPEGQSFADWVAKGLVTAPRDPLDHNGDGKKGGSLSKTNPITAA